MRAFFRSVQFIRQTIDFKQLLKLVNIVSGNQIIELNPNKKEKIIVLSPHPDDDIFGVGGTLLRHQQNGDTIQVLYLCRGDGGGARSRDDILAKKRQAEATEALAKLGGTAIFWQIRDGSLSPSSELVAKLARLLSEYQPTRIYVPWFGDNHQDHQGCAELLKLSSAKAIASADIWQYEIWSPLLPNRYVDISQVTQQKKQLMSFHKSQIQDNANFETGIIGLNSYRGMQIGVQTAEAFLVIRDREMKELF